MLVGAGKPRGLLALLALSAGSTISTDRLVEGLWGEAPPATAAKMVQLYVSQLRKALAGGGDGAEIVTRGRGYELRLGDGELDARRFEELVAAGAARDALSLWRGAPLADVADEPFAAAQIRRLDELRVAALELAINGDLAAGRHREVAGELETLVAEHPLRERLHAQRMLALYRCGRQAEALDAYRQARSVLVEEIGVEPGPELRRLHEAILRQDPELDPPAADAVELPPELDAGTPLAGREAELDALREQWRRVHGGAGRLVLVVGGPGMGKTRLTAELAGEVHRDRGAVLYASGAGAPETALASLASARVAQRPTLLVLDDVDRAGEEVWAALGDLGGGLAALPVLVVAASQEAGLPTGLRTDATIVLAPLDADDVRAVARLYAGAREDAEVPVARLAEASGGVPQRLHRAADEWARTRALRHLTDTAGRIAAERPGLRAAEDDLVGNIVELQAARERAEPGAVAAEGVVACPFKGLASFDVDDVEVFFGRERLVAEMVARLTGAPLMGIVGPSGSGKSSALRAGLLAALAAGVLPGSEHWALALLRPGEHPMRALEQATADAPTRGRLVLAVDQFEEAFTACREERERSAFVDALVASARDPRRRALVLLAVRADFYGRCAAYPELARLLGANHVLVGSMRRDELRRAIELPARHAGLGVEPELVDVLIGDVEGEPGALPLLSTSLVELWQHRDGRRLRISAYAQAGGVRGAVARLAESAYERLDPEQREVARRILLRLAGEGEAAAVVRRRVPLAELEGERDESVAEVLAVLADDRLVTIGEGEVEVAHEALLREWPRLRGWLEEDAQGRRLRHHLGATAREWDAGGRDRGELYRGARLASALDWIAAHEHELNELEREFVAESRAVAELEAERQQEANRRLRALLAGVAALLTLAVVAGVVALSQRGEARDAALVADAQRLGAEALTNDRLDQALLLARAGVALHDATPTRSSLLSVLMRTPAALGVLSATGWSLYTVAVSPDQRLVAVGGERGIVRIFDAATRRRLNVPYGLREGLVQTLTFSPDGRTLAVTGQEPQNLPPGALVDLVDPSTGARRHRIVLPRFPDPSSYIVAHLAFLPNRRDLIVQQQHNDYPDGPASVLWRVNGHTGTVDGPPLRVGTRASSPPSLTADGRRLFVSSVNDDATFEIDPQRLRVLHRYPVGAAAGAVSPDGRAFALGSQAGGVRLLDLRSGAVGRFAGRHQGAIERMRFTPDGRTLVTSAADGNVIAWDVARGEIRETFPGHSGDVYGLAVSTDGRTVYSAANDGRAIVWDLVGDRRLDRPFAAGRPFVADDGDQYPIELALSADGRTLALTQDDGTVNFVDTHTLRRRGSLRAMPGFTAAVEYSTDGRLLAVTGKGGPITLWDARTLRPAGTLRGLRSTSQALAFSPDGRMLAAAELGQYVKQRYEGSSVRVWDLRRRVLTPVHFLARHGAANFFPALAFSPDGRLLAAAAAGDGTEIRDAHTGRLVVRLHTDDLARSVAFSPDGKLIATGQYDGRLLLWSTRNWRPVGRPVEAHEGRVITLSFSRDGRTLASASEDGTMRLWDVGSEKPVGSPLVVGHGAWVSAALTPDGSHLLAVSDQGRGVRWDISPAAWKRHACRVAGRELTAREWQDALPGRPYRSICQGG
ncbi:MAG: BTAD domain-containing putative transcriptional regulator [Solirubrobacteraceae bacterium]